MLHDRINFKEMIYSSLKSKHHSVIDEFFGLIIDILGIDSKVEKIKQEFNPYKFSSDLEVLKKRFGYLDSTNAYFMQECVIEFKKCVEDYQSCKNNIDKVDYLMNNYLLRFIGDNLFQIIKSVLGKEVGIEFVIAKNSAHRELKERNNQKNRLLGDYFFAQELLSSFYLFNLFERSEVKDSYEASDLTKKYILKKHLISISGVNKETFRKVCLRSGMDMSIIQGNISRKDCHSVLYYFLEGKKDLNSPLTFFKSLKNFYIINYQYSELLKLLEYHQIESFGLTNKKKDLIRFINLFKGNKEGVFYYDKIYQYGISAEEELKYKNSDIIEFWLLKKITFKVLNISNFDEVFLKNNILSNN
ncbi:MAG: hypothetical protein LBI72_12515 [Flavobacteriaceae bacterium]|jgi:hypothetical protein|nr:hypothetical protein [Flavobacteriaceae bacterium]